MNKVILTGRMIKDPEMRVSGETAIAKFTLAVDRKTKKGAEKKADFITCTAFGNQATFIEKYFKKGDGIDIEGRIQTGSYKNKEGATVYTTDVIVDSVEFPLTNKSNGGSNRSNEEPKAAPKQDDDGFMNIPDGIDTELPFN